MSKRSNILLVDDEAIILAALKRELSRENFAITLASSGEEAVSKIHSKNFDLVITDLVMSGIDGIQVLKEAKKIDVLTSVIILTGYGNLSSAVDALRLGASDYLLKPCDIDKLFFSVHKCLETRESQKRLEFYDKIIPVCCVCGSIRDDLGLGPGEGHWLKVDQFIIRRSDSHVSHSYCPTCGEKALDQVKNYLKNNSDH